MVNIRDIAELTGVSITTVSRVLNHHPYVSEAKRKLVKEAVEKLQYRQNANAVHLVTGRTNVIAVMLPFVNFPYYSALLSGIAESALAANYRIVVCQTNYVRAEERKVLELLATKQIDGIIVASASTSLAEMKPFGNVVACEQTDDVASVYVDHYAGFKLGLDYLVHKGHRHIGYCMARKNSMNSKSRDRAYKDTLAALDEPLRAEWMFHNCMTFADGERVVEQLQQLDERPTAIFATNDHIAAGIVTAAKRIGWRIPEELAVLGFDNETLAEALQLTTIRHPLAELGMAAFKRLIDGEEGDPLSFQLVERGSC